MSAILALIALDRMYDVGDALVERWHGLVYVGEQLDAPHIHDQREDETATKKGMLLGQAEGHFALRRVRAPSTLSKKERKSVGDVGSQDVASEREEFVESKKSIIETAMRREREREANTRVGLGVEEQEEGPLGFNFAATPLQLTFHYRTRSLRQRGRGCQGVEASGP